MWLLFLTGLFEDLPEATLAAVVIAALIELVDYKALAELWRAWSSRLGRIYGLAARADFIAAVAAMLGVLVFDTLPGLLIGVAGSLLLLYRVSRPHVAVLGEIPGSGGQWADTAHHPEDQAVPGVAVLRVECSSPTPTTCAPKSRTPPPLMAPRRWRWTARPCRPST